MKLPTPPKALHPDTQDMNDRMNVVTINYSRIIRKQQFLSVYLPLKVIHFLVSVCNLVFINSC